MILLLLLALLGASATVSAEETEAAPEAVVEPAAVELAPADPVPSTDPDPAYRGELLARARERKLWEERYWRLLLHYRKGVTGTFSEAGWKGFFLSPRGKRNPQAELEATLEAMFADEPADPNAHAQCRFAARWGWLKEILAIDSARLPDRACPAYNTWHREFDLESVSVVFASSHLGNPSSMYGHTFLLLHKRDNDNWLLDPSLNFAADVTTNNGMLYLLYGVLGFFPGRFSAMPYYMKVQQYNNLENRDLWEYRLGFDTASVERLRRHVWEMEGLYFPYYFFNKNCSYQLLPMLEVADPRLHLTDHWPLYVVPADTIRAILKQPGLVAGQVYRPSRFARMVANRNVLAEPELGLVERLARPQDATAFEGVQALAPERQARVLDSASEFLEYRIDYRRNPPGGLLERQRQVNVTRGRLDIPTLTPAAAPGSPPEAGHRTTRLSLSYGEGRWSSFESMAFRFALHDLLDRSPGYRANSTLEMGHLELRREHETRKVQLDRFDIVRLVSLFPRDRWSQRKSWKFGFGLERARDLAGPAAAAPLIFRLNFGMGPAFESRILRREIVYGMVELDAGAAGPLRGNTRWGGGGTVGTLLEPTSWWRIRGEATALDYVLGDRRGNRRYLVEQSLSLTRNLALRGRWERQGGETQKSISIQRYF